MSCLHAHAVHMAHSFAMCAQAAKQPGYVPARQRPEAAFVPSLLDDFLSALDAAVVEQGGDEGEAGGPVDAVPREPPSVVVHRPALAHCERSLELLIDLLSQLPTRRCVSARERVALYGSHGG